MTPTGLISLPSKYDPSETSKRFVAALEKRGMSVFARIDHAAAAQAVGLELRPTEVFLFGNPRAGTLLMQDVQTIGIDLPLKALIWQDEAGLTWFSYNDVGFLTSRHGASPAIDKAGSAMSSAVGDLARESVGPSEPVRGALQSPTHGK